MRHLTPATRFTTLTLVVLALMPVLLVAQRALPTSPRAVAVEPDISPVGVYVMKTTQPLMGAAEYDVNCTVVRGDTGAFSGTCGNPGSGDVPIGTVTTAGNVVTIAGETPIGPFKVLVTVVSGVAEGTISVGNETAKLKGTFAPK